MIALAVKPFLLRGQQGSLSPYMSEKQIVALEWGLVAFAAGAGLVLSDGAPIDNAVFMGFTALPLGVLAGYAAASI